MLTDEQLVIPDWPAPSGVRAFVTTRAGGVSTGPWGSLNLGKHVGDDLAAVAENRRRVYERLPRPPVWLSLVHGSLAVRAEDWADAGTSPEADGVATNRIGLPCLVTAADCLPVIFCDDAGSAVAVAHAGWRGLALGVLEQTVAAMGVAPDRVMAWLGPAIGPNAFEVGSEVRDAFLAVDPAAEAAFVAHSGPASGKYRADLYLLARQRLARAGVARVHGGNFCTFTERERFFSYRRDKVTGRMGAVIWLES